MADYTIPTSPLKRLRYYNNQFLAEKDFIDEQAAHLAHERAHLRAMCSPGLWEGLVVSYAALPTTSAPTVGGGIAVDDQGRLIVLAAAAAGPAPSTLANGDHVLSIQYNEVATDMSTNTGGAAGTADNTRFTSQPALAATAATAVPAGAVVLGSFTVTGGQITAKSDAGRQYAGLRLPGPVLAGNPPPPPATLANRNDGSADGARLSGTLTVQKTSATAIGPSLTLANPNLAPGGANAGGAIDFNSYDPGTNAPTARIQSLGDANFSSHLSISTKAPGAIGNALVERLRITSSGAAQFRGGVSAQSMSAPTFNGAVRFTGAVTAPSLTVPTFNGPVQFTDPVSAPSLTVPTFNGPVQFTDPVSAPSLTVPTFNGPVQFTDPVSAPSLTVPTFNGPVQFAGAVSAPALTVSTFNGPVQFTGPVTVSSQLLTASAGLSVTGALSVSGTATIGALTVGSLSVTGAATNLQGTANGIHTLMAGGTSMFLINPGAKRITLVSGWILQGTVTP